jgi:two-component system sensor histidine kinase BraS/BceS
LTLQQFIYVKELDDFNLPSEKAFKAIICKQKEAHASDLLEIQTQMEDVQNLIKMWSHQMKVPLSALSLMAQTNQLEPKEVEQQLNRLQNYLDTLLNYLKFSQNKDDFRFEKLSVKNIVTSIIKKYRIPCLLKHLSVEVTGNWELNSDRKWVNFALTQLIDNAIKYSKEGGKIAIRISQSSIEISDDGIGILEEDLPRIFEEGFTGFNGHEHQKATGLGLYMTKQVLDSLNLDITIHSQIDQGTQVFITPKKR